MQKYLFGRGLITQLKNCISGAVHQTVSDDSVDDVRRGLDDLTQFQNLDEANFNRPDFHIAHDTMNSGFLGEVVEYNSNIFIRRDFCAGFFVYVVNSDMLLASFFFARSLFFFFSLSPSLSPPPLPPSPSLSSFDIKISKCGGRGSLNILDFLI